MDERERQYQEYLSLREHKHNEEHTYGESEMRRIYREKAQREHREALEEQRRHREHEEYLAMREKRQAEPEEPETRSLKERLFSREESGFKENRSHNKSSFGRKNKGKNRWPKFEFKGPGSKAKRTIRGTVIAALAAGVVVLGGLLLLFGALISMDDVDIDKSAIAINPEVATQLDKYTNIAVLGTDARADDDQSAARSDAIIVASINNETNEVKMFSVFRDTLLDVGDQGLDKITHAYHYGGAQQSLYALNKNLDLNIDKVVIINWKTVADTIDAVGGIEINVKESEIDEMNKYIKETAKNVGGPDDKIKGPGKQTLNGVQAVTYSRIRKDAATGDYRRNERMKVVFSETFKKLKHSGYFKMFRVTRKVLPEVGTNMSSSEIMKMVLKFKLYDMTDSTTGFPYDVGSWTGSAGAGYAWYGPPINLSNNVSKLHEQFFDQGGYTPTDTVQEISTRISELTGLY